MALIDNSLTREQISELQIPRSKPEWLLEVVAVAGLVVMLVFLALYYADLPQTIPTHYNFAGEVDGWGSKATILIFLGIGLLIYLPMTLVPLKPQIANYPVPLTAENAERQIRLVRGLLLFYKAAIVWLMCYFVVMILRTAQGQLVPSMGPLFLVAIMVLMVVPIVPYFILAHRWQ